MSRDLGEGDGAHIGLSDDVATLWSDHYALTELIATGIFNGLEHTAWDTRSPLDTGPVVKFTVVVGRTVVYPVTLGRSSINIDDSKKQLKRRQTFLTTTIAHIVWRKSSLGLLVGSMRSVWLSTTKGTAWVIVDAHSTVQDRQSQQEGRGKT